ncbi:MAG: response regulator [Chitinophagaceae bacterium]|nr:response regulator [Chitinophagaceae bacterium]
MKKILLIEDNLDILNNTAEILELSNYRVFLAENGKIGVEQAIKNEPDLIICDIMMPVLDGYGVLHAIHKNEAIKNTPFIFLTAKTDRQDFRKGMELGADDYITKPFSGTELLNAIDSRLKKIDLLKDGLVTENKALLEAAGGSIDLKAFTEGRNINRYKKKQVIYSEGNHPNCLYYVLKGKVKVSKTNDDGKEFVTELFSPGDYMGYIALFEETVYQDTAKAMEETELAVIPREEFEELINHNLEVTQTFIHLLANNVSEKENQLLGIAYNSLRKKVAEALLLIQKKYQQEKDEKFVIDINRDSLATIAGTAKESLIRTLGDFKNEKLIDVDGGGIVIVNQKKLEHLLN